MVKKNSQKKSSVIVGIFSSSFFFKLHAFSVTEQHNKLQGSVVLKQNRAVPLGLWNNTSDPIHSTLCLGFILALNAQMLWLFFG